MRWLLGFASATVAVEMVLYSALAPLLPVLREEFGLSKAQAGVLVAMYAVGLAVAALPVGVLASRIGSKGASLVGLVALAATSVGFGLVDTFAGLLVTRLLEGVAGAACWAGAFAWIVEATPRHRRASVIGLAAGASAAGAVVGPAVGGLAVLVGRGWAFGGVAGLALVLAAVAWRLPGTGAQAQPALELVSRAFGSRELVAGQWLVVVPGLLLGTAAVLAPLRLHDLGWDAPRIAVVYLVAASIGVVVRPLVGNWADRLGQRFAIRVLLLACVVVTVAIPLARDAWLLSVVVLVAVVTYGVMWGPAMALVSSSFERAGVGQSACFALMNLTGGLGVLVGSAAGSAIAARAGDATAYLFVAAICLATYALVAQSRTPARAEGVR